MSHKATGQNRPSIPQDLTSLRYVIAQELEELQVTLNAHSCVVSLFAYQDDNSPISPEQIYWLEPLLNRTLTGNHQVLSAVIAEV